MYGFETQLNEPIIIFYFLILSILHQHAIRNFNVVVSNRKNMDRISVKKTNKILSFKIVLTQVSRVRTCVLP